MNGLRKALKDGEHGARYIGTIPGRGYCFVAPVSRLQAAEARSEHSASDPRAALPARLTRMIGRSEAVDAICDTLLTSRFVTIVGPGGIGKTTVAICAGHHLLESFDGAVRFVDLGAITDPQLVPTMVSSAVGFVAHASDLVPNLISFLQDKRLLIILDSCEHLIDAAASLAERLVTEAPGIHLLVTSREALRVEGEHVHQLLTLEIPPSGTDLDSAGALAFAAVQLFVERVTASGLRFELTDADAPAVAEICRSLDGIPLALELAAGRVNAYGVRGIAALLGDQFSRIANGRRTAVPRHQTLSATLDWSHQLLTAEERILFRRLAVFVGSFDFDAAESVAAFGELDRSTTLESLGNLVSKSLIAPDFSSSRSCYRLLDTTRTYAREKLVEAGEAHELSRRHALHYLRMLDPRSGGPEPAEGGAAPSREHLGNIRAALAWCFEEEGDQEIGTSLAAAAAPLLVELSLLSECCRWSQRGIAALDEKTRGTRREINLQAALGHSLMFTEGNSERVRRAFARGLELARALKEPLMEMRLLGGLHLFNERIGNYHGAVEFAERSEVVAKDLGQPAALAAAGSFLGLSQHLVGNHLAARPLLEASLAQEIASPQAKTIHFGFDYANRSRITLARVLWLVGEADRATELAELTIADAARMRHPVTLCIALIWGITVSLWVGDEAGSEVKIARFAAHAKKHSLNPYNAVAIGYKGELCVQRGEGDLAVAHLQNALETLHGARYELVTTTFMISLAQAFAMTGRDAEARAAIDEALGLVQQNGDLLYMPEALRVKGAILAGAHEPDPEAAEVSLRAALNWSKLQSALAWELRAATSLASLRVQQGRHAEAHDVLAPVYDRFTEGFATADLQAARNLLDGLASRAGHSDPQQSGAAGAVAAADIT